MRRRPRLGTTWGLPCPANFGHGVAVCRRREETKILAEIFAAFARYPRPGVPCPFRKIEIAKDTLYLDTYILG